MKRELFLVGLFWAALTAVGEAAVLSTDIHPLAKSDKGEEIVDAFNILMVMAVPVMMLVVAVLVYSVLMHRGSGGDTPPEDGEVIYGRGPVPTAWFAVTAGLTLLVMIYPGLTSLKDVVADPTPDLVVDVTGVQWTWLVSYPDENVENQRELVLPVDRTVRFNVESLDVLHSFWVPAFAMKIDAVPGKTTGFTLVPTEVGSFETDELMRVQCAELCGLSHGRMQIPVRVLSESEFEQWLSEVEATPAPVSSPGAEVEAVEISANNTEFDKGELTVKGGGPITVRFTNEEKVPHNWALYETEEAAAGGGAAMAKTSIKPGPLTEDATFDAPAPGAYFFRCDAHPAQMKGTLVVE